MATRRKRSEHYVNNKEFLAALEVYIAQVNRAKLNDKEPPQIPRYIGECFLKIANHLSYKPNFVNYMFKDDICLLYTSPSPRDCLLSRMPSSA